jgi:hypothetical protein
MQLQFVGRKAITTSPNYQLVWLTTWKKILTINKQQSYSFILINAYVHAVRVKSVARLEFVYIWILSACVLQTLLFFFTAQLRSARHWYRQECWLPCQQLVRSWYSWYASSVLSSAAATDTKVTHSCGVVTTVSIVTLTRRIPMDDRATNDRLTLTLHADAEVCS